jgi:ISXO2-like transposase domain
MRQETEMRKTLLAIATAGAIMPIQGHAKELSDAAWHKKFDNCEMTDRRGPKTQTIEGFWSIFKRGVVGTFHKMSRKYMPLYVAEFQFRYNNRVNADIFGTVIKGC